VPRPRKRNPLITTGEVMLWLLFVALLVPAGAVGWAIGHYTGHNTVTVTAGAAPTTTAAVPTTTVVASATTAAASPTAYGKTVFAANGCGSCHTFKPAKATAKVGPDLDRLAAEAKRAGKPLDAFVKQSIVDPNAYVEPGFPKGVMPPNFGDTIKPNELDALVQYLASGAK